MFTHTGSVTKRFDLRDCRGSRSPRATLNADQARAIFAARDLEDAAKVADRFGVSARLVRKIWARKAYAADTWQGSGHGTVTV